MFNHFSLLLWKNFRKQVYKPFQLFFSILFPTLFTSLLIAVNFKITLENDLEVKEFRDIEFSEWWGRFLDIIKSRRDFMMSKRSTFTHSVFVPQLKIGYAPRTGAAEKISKRAIRYLQDLELLDFDNCDILRTFMRVKNYIAGVCFMNMSNHEIPIPGGSVYPRHLHLQIILPAEFRRYKDSYVGSYWDTSSEYDYFRSLEDRANEGEDGGSPGYIREGVASIQYYFSRAYIELISNSKLPQVRMKRFDVVETVFDLLCDGMEICLSLVIIVGYVYPITMLTHTMVHERDTKQRYLLNTNRVSYRLQMFSWFVTGFCQLLVADALLLFLLKFPFNNGKAIIQHNPLIIIILFFVFYSAASVAFCILMSAICANTTVVIAVVPVVWVLSVLAFTSRRDQITSLYFSDVMNWLIVNDTFQDGIHRIVQFERFMKDFNVYEYIIWCTSIDSYSLLLMYCAFSCHTALYFSLAILLDFDSGFCKYLQQKYYILIHKCMQVDPLPKQLLLVPNPEIEEVDQNKIGNKKPVLVMENVWKKYREYYSIKNFNLKLYEDEIVCLLGHNTAGKSTLMNLLCGVTAPTYGKITIGGYNIITKPLEAYKHIGFSLRNVEIFEELTLGENLLFFSQLRGYTKAQAKMELKQTIKDMKLSKLEDVNILNLTPGHRQYLNLLCAFMGNPKIILLERPIAGLDTYLSSNFFKFLEKKKSGCTILLTSYISRLAETCADRLGIVLNGELACLGSPVFFKAIKKSHYYLYCYRGEECKVEVVLAFLKHYVKDVVKKLDCANTTIFLISGDYNDKLIELLKNLDKYSLKLHITSYKLFKSPIPITITDNGSTEVRQTTEEAKTISEKIKLLESVRLEMHAGNRLYGVRRFFMRVWVVWHQRFLIDVRYPLLTIIQMLLPTFICIIMFSMPNAPIERKKVSGTRIFTLNNYDESVTIYKSSVKSPHMIRTLKAYTNVSKYHTTNHKFINPPEKTIREFLVERLKRKQFHTDTNTLVAATFSDDLIIAWFNNYVLHGVPLSLHMVLDAMAYGIGHGAHIIHSVSFLPFSTAQYAAFGRGPLKIDNAFAIILTFCFCFTWTYPMMKESMQNAQTFMQLQAIAGLGPGSVTFATILYQLIKVCFSLLPLNNLLFIFRFHKLMDIEVYCLLVLCILVTAFCVLCINNLLVEFVKGEHSRYVLVTVANAATILVFLSVYELYMFYIPNYHQQHAIFLEFCPYYTLPLMLIQLFSYVDIRSACTDRQTMEMAQFVEKCQVQPNCCKNHLDLSPYWIKLLSVSFVSIMILFIRKYSAIAKPFDWYNTSLNDNVADNKYDQYLRHFTRIDKRDESYTRENIRVRTVELSRLLLKSLHCDNVYVRIHNHLLLKRINLMIERYQTFALLGLNGGGKSLLLQSIVGHVPLSAGKIHIDYCNVALDVSKAHKCLAYCPQTDVMMDGITVAETIKFIFIIHGIRYKQAQMLALKLCKILEIYRYRNHTIRNCGPSVVKRAGIALCWVGLPSLIILDDPFSTLDLICKQTVYTIISKANQYGQSVLLTSCEPIDCEHLSRVGILLNKRFSAVGGLTEIMDGYYSDYYMVMVKFSTEILEDITAPSFYLDYPQFKAERNITTREKRYCILTLIEQLFPEAIIIEITFMFASFWLSKDKYKFHDILAIINAKPNCFFSFTISPPSLRSLFSDLKGRPDIEDEFIAHTETT